MNKENFIKYTTDFSQLNEKSLEEIKAILDEFPHFQTAWILYAKNLYLLKDVRFDSKLKLAATYVADREILKKILNETYNPYETQIEAKQSSPKVKPTIVIPQTETIDKSTIQTKNEIVETVDNSDESNVEETTSQNADKQEFIIEKSDKSVADKIIENINKIKDNKKSELEENITSTEEKPNTNDSGLSISTDKHIAETPAIEKQATTSSTHVDTEKESIPQSNSGITTQPTTNAADKVLGNIKDIKEGNLEKNEESTQEPDNTQDLQNIIAQRLAELGIKTKETKPEIVEEKQEVENEEVISFDQITEQNEQRSKDKVYEKLDISSKDFVNFDFSESKIGVKSENIAEKSKKKQEKSKKNTKKNIDLIDKFLLSNPRIIPKKEFASNDTAAINLGLSEDEELFSETLAKIYVKQEHFDKAILTYEKLCLKYPEKNIYFASQIEKIKKLIKNKKD